MRRRLAAALLLAAGASCEWIPGGYDATLYGERVHTLFADDGRPGRAMIALLFVPPELLLAQYSAGAHCGRLSTYLVSCGTCLAPLPFRMR